MFNPPVLFSCLTGHRARSEEFLRPVEFLHGLTLILQRSQLEYKECTLFLVVVVYSKE